MLNAVRATKKELQQVKATLGVYAEDEPMFRKRGLLTTKRGPE